MKKLSFILLIALSSCSNVGEYVYIDKYMVLHVDRTCKEINRGKSPATERVKAKEASRYSGYDAKYYHYRDICSYCVSDADYEELTNKE